MVAGLLGILIQIQHTFELDGTAIRLNLADAVLLLSGPFLLIYLLRCRMQLLGVAGIPLLVTLAACTAVLSLSLLVGQSEINVWDRWAILKYLGWFVLLGYGLFGVMLASLGGQSAGRALAAGLIGLQLLIYPVFCVSMWFWLQLPVKFGSRLQGLTDNPNAMALIGLTGLSVALGLNIHLEKRLGRLAAAAVPGVLTAMVLLTGSVAAVAAVAILVTMVLVFRSVAMKKMILIVLCGGLFWLVPQLTGGDAAKNVIFKTYSVVSMLGELFGVPDMWPAVATDVTNENESTARQQSMEGYRLGTLEGRTQSYKYALQQFVKHPLLGAGLGTHLYKQEPLGEDKDTRVQIHNTPLWLAAETGLLGLFTFSTLFVLLSLRLGRTMIAPEGHEAGHEAAWPAFALSTVLMLIAALVMSMFHEILYQRVIWLVIGFSLPFTVSIGAGKDQ